MSEFNATVEVSKQVQSTLLAAEDVGLAVYASFHANVTDETFEVSLYNDEGGVIHQGMYKVVPA
ncbi:hypothetical protein SEA_PIONEER3_61 [Microbacterium phage Pioneer3]|nr:hypothetical protein SEA_PIONEER3_61 [Microbacterium phage Pioneer3]